MKSKWADDEQEAADAAQRKREKEEKKRAKAEKQRQQELRQQAQAQQDNQGDRSIGGQDARPNKRRRLSQDGQTNGQESTSKLLRFETPGWAPARTIADYETLNPIEEGTYGYVSRARSRGTGEIVALKKMKLEQGGAYGIPVTALREIQTLQQARHRNVIELKEVVIGEDGSGSKPDDIFLVMEFAAHDLKTLIEEMTEPFMPSEVKTLMQQLASGLAFIHNAWILHRDLKTSNILLTSAGCVKLADFGMARLTSDPPPQNLTALVVTLWYRGPELLLGAPVYDSAVDMWSLGCVFGELLTGEPLLPGRNEVDQLSKIFELVGIPSDTVWPGFRRLPHARTLRLPSKSATAGRLRERFAHLTPAGQELLAALLLLDPNRRPDAKATLEHDYFSEDPRPKAEALLPSFPSKAGMEKRRRQRTPDAPARGQPAVAVDFSSVFVNSSGGDQHRPGAGGFQLRG